MKTYVWPIFFLNTFLLEKKEKETKLPNALRTHVYSVGAQFMYGWGFVFLP